MTYRSSRKGLALALVLAVVTVLFLVGSAVGELGATNAQMVVRQGNQTLARQSMDAAVSYAIYSLDAAPDWTKVNVNATGVPLDASDGALLNTIQRLQPASDAAAAQDLAGGQATGRAYYDIRAAYASATQVTLQATGYVKDTDGQTVLGRTATLVSFHRASNPFQNPVRLAHGATVSGSSLLAASGDVALRTDAGASNSISVDGGSHVQGNVEVGPVAANGSPTDVASIAPGALTGTLGSSPSTGELASVNDNGAASSSTTPQNVTVGALSSTPTSTTQVLSASASSQSRQCHCNGFFSCLGDAIGDFLHGAGQVIKGVFDEVGSIFSGLSGNTSQAQNLQSKASGSFNQAQQDFSDGAGDITMAVNDLWGGGGGNNSGTQVASGESSAPGGQTGGTSAAPPSQGNVASSSGPVVLNPGRYGDLASTQGGQVTLNPGTYYFNSITLTNGSTMTVAGTASQRTTIFLEGSAGQPSLQVANSRIVNSSGSPSNLMILVAPSSYQQSAAAQTTKTVSLSNAGTLDAGIYAPDAGMSVSSTTVNGSLVADSLNLSGSTVDFSDYKSSMQQVTLDGIGPPTIVGREEMP